MSSNLSQYTFPAEVLEAIVLVLTESASSDDWDELHLEMRYLSDDAAEVGYFRYFNGQSCLIELDDQAYFLIEDERDKLLDRHEKVWRQFQLKIAKEDGELDRSVTLQLGYEPFTTIDSLVAKNEPGA